MHNRYNANITSNYPDCFESLKDTSLDSISRIYLISSISDNVINFDKLTKKFYTGTIVPKSNDALILKPAFNYLIEFKNQTKEALEKPNNTLNLFKKNGSSIATLLGNQLTNLSVLKNNYIYILVYNDKKNYKQKLNRSLPGGNNSVIPFKLAYFKAHYFYDVKVFSDPLDFENYYHKNILTGRP